MLLIGETVAANMRSILDKIYSAAPATPVFVCEILPTTGRPDELIYAINAAVEDVVKGFPNAHRIRAHDLFLNRPVTLMTPAALFNRRLQ